MRTNWMALGLMVLLAGCFGPSKEQVASHYDPVTGSQTDFMEDNLLELDTEGPPREVVWLNASREFKGNGEMDYYLEAVYMARDEVGFIDIEPGESLVVVVDNQEMKFSGIGSGLNRKTMDGFSHERALFRATRIDLQRIAVAHRVKVRIIGRNGLVEREFNEANFDRFRKFVSLYAL